MENLYEATIMRVEHKFLMNGDQMKEFLKLASPHLKPDLYPSYDLFNVYYDTPDNSMIIHCLTHPQYKEKLRLRSYGDSENAFLEIKKKFKETGLKRRINITETKAYDFIHGNEPLTDPSQIANEIKFLVDSRGVEEKVFIAYHREAFSGVAEEDLRITFDTDICYRLDDLNLSKNGTETMLTKGDEVLLEIKVKDRYPLWLVKILSEMKLYRTSFSKYGMIYSELIRKRGSNGPLS